jgi:transcriptional regulator GlxA family with amidase domain
LGCFTGSACKNGSQQWNVLNKQYMKIGILAYTHCTSSMVLGVLDILSYANTQWGGGLFDIDIVTATGQPALSFSKHPIAANKSFKTKTRFDLIYIPGFLADVNEVLKREEGSVRWLQKQFKAGAKIAAACNGNFLLAETGILKNRRATTHWSLIKEFKARYRDVLLQPEKIIIDEGNIISAAGVTAYLNLSVYLVHRFASPELASLCSKVFLVDSGRRIQTPYENYTLPKKHGDDPIVHTQEWLEKNFKEPISLDAIAQIGNLGKRTLIRRFKRATGDTPLVYLQRLRIENAKRLLEATSSTFSEITWQVGYEDVSSFQRLFKIETGLSPKEYRTKFSLI